MLSLKHNSRILSGDPFTMAVRFDSIELVITLIRCNLEEKSNLLIISILLSFILSFGGITEHKT